MRCHLDLDPTEFLKLAERLREEALNSVHYKAYAKVCRQLTLLQRKQFRVKRKYKGLRQECKFVTEKLDKLQNWQLWPPAESGIYYAKFRTLPSAIIYTDVFYIQPSSSGIAFRGQMDLSTGTKIYNFSNPGIEWLAYCGPFKQPGDFE